MKGISALLCPVLLLPAGCGLLNDSDESTRQQEDLFPLKVGRQWTYHITEADLDTSRVGFPTRFTVSVVGERTVEGEKYYLLADYVVPGPSLPDTILVRSIGSKVFIRFAPDQEERLFYSFAPADTLWNVPMYVNADTTYSYHGSLLNVTARSATVRWGPFPYPRGEAGWEEAFEHGIGRAKIVSVSQAFGRVVWKLEKVLSGPDADEWTEGTLKLLEGFQPSLYVVVPDSNTGTAFALSGLPDFLPSDNLPEEFRQDGLRVIFVGEVVNVPPEIRLPAVPLKVTGIKRLER